MSSSFVQFSLQTGNITIPCGINVKHIVSVQQCDDDENHTAIALDDGQTMVVTEKYSNVMLQIKKSNGFI